MAFNDDAVIVTVYYNDVTGRPTRITTHSDYVSPLHVEFMVDNGTRTAEFRRSIQPGDNEFNLTPGQANQYMFPNVYIEGSVAP